ncbi:hypothetical protein L484_015943 [Morus notabilis]|uniref:Uncharacterized protein n=1 Tax=Morus notabilis TaxID=981085 RepID=W9RAA7_9ROSA|nr:hypothetical protein L484_015943 [Morus notabilis]
MDKFLNSFGSLAKLEIGRSIEWWLAGGLRDVSPREPSVPQFERSISDFEDKDFGLWYLGHNPHSALTKEEV